MEVLRITDLPPEPLAAAAQFHGEVVATLPHDADLLLVFPPADHTQREWRAAAVAALARAHAPRRINAVASDSDAGIASALAYLSGAAGITGQYLPLDDAGAGTVLPSAA
ncbi:Rossmann fold domain-containing protein [Novosphingobium sp.]|uniref:Rossmann fold domain-containing protein n=1 Tax=Novosphingobium sp. TaxID=1874826 RepID=UPI002732AC5C|nr:hypothetical protein [Novosphingobium sp.]MDP3908138.1 hypothetical protein [Novosphingobium sp.]